MMDSLLVYFSGFGEGPLYIALWMTVSGQAACSIFESLALWLFRPQKVGFFPVEISVVGRKMRETLSWHLGALGWPRVHAF